MVNERCVKSESMKKTAKFLPVNASLDHSNYISNDELCTSQIVLLYTGLSIMYAALYIIYTGISIIYTGLFIISTGLFITKLKGLSSIRMLDLYCHKPSLG